MDPQPPEQQQQQPQQQPIAATSSSSSFSSAAAATATSASPLTPTPNPNLTASARPSLPVPTHFSSFTNTSTLRPGIGMLRPQSGVSVQNQHLRAVVPSPIRTPTLPLASSPSTLSSTQSFQAHGFMRPSSVGPNSSHIPNTSPSVPSPNQPWLTAGSQGKPPLPTPSHRPQLNSPSLQQRPHIPQHHTPPTQPQLPSHQPHDRHGPQFAPPRAAQPSPTPQQVTVGQGSANQKGSPVAPLQPNTVQPFAPNGRTVNVEGDESDHRILGKRTIQELVSQVDPLEKLDPEVEDILADIADDFVESITTFGCSLAKHRKSDTLEAKDILLHLERNWNITLPGFSGDEIKTYRKPLMNDIHKERLAAIRKSILASDVANARNSVAQASGNARNNIKNASLS